MVNSETGREKQNWNPGRCKKMIEKLEVKISNK
jgi:hypothetical protein